MMFVIKEMIKNNIDPVLINLLHIHADYFYSTAMDNLNSKHDKEILSKYMDEIKALKEEKPK